ncbi:MAG TPA: hypothetical protein VMJ93_02320 [Verrucomicrobiae bacterium]|nr:hypothetical protein [Verrucomicrobiae bacterium]HUN63791.1 hypothetical protein [Candidatus Sulfotelmatobacter sp.]
MGRLKKSVIVSIVGGILGFCVFYFHRHWADGVNTADFRPLTNLIAARIAPLIIIPVKGSPTPRADAKYVYTYTNAVELSKRLQLLTVEANTPRSALDIADIEGGLRFDGWGRPFCIIRNEDRLAIFSGGQEGFDSVGCEAVKSLRKDIPGMKTGVLNIYPNGVLVLVVSDQT